MHEFGLTVAFAIGISLLISFTLTPMLSARYLKFKRKDHKVDTHQHGLIARVYGVVVAWALRHRWVTVVVAIACLAAVVPIVKALGKDFMPYDDRSEFQVTLTVPGGSSLDAADELFGRIEDELHRVKGITKTLTQIGSKTAGSEDVTQGQIYVALEDLSQRQYTQVDKMKEVRRLLAKYPEIRTSVNYTGMMGGGRSVQLQYNLVGPDLEVLNRASEQVANKLRQVPGFVDVDTSLASRQPEIRLTLDRPKAADMGISAVDVASTLRTMVGGEKVTKYREGVEQYDVWLRLDRRDRSDGELIEALPLISPRAGLVPLSQVATLSDGQGPSAIDRTARRRMVSIYANLDGLDMSRATQILQKAVSELELPPGYGTVETGQVKAMGETMRNMIMAFAMAFIFMYIVLAAQFESFLHPVTILLSLPLTLPFALVSLLMLGESVNVYSLLGVFMLFGIVKKNGILQIDYTNTLRSRGVPIREAIVEANMARVRPILMTTLTLIAGMTPIALGQGPGAAARASLAKVIIGGQALSLFITLLIVPVAYSGFESIKNRLGIGRVLQPRDDIAASTPISTEQATT
jgi:HAE1 family hydrophobic/amphiphilic exporter-1